ncbi:sensor histidine kinase [Streptomyces niger]|uniref:sensor histidine kinase n=1 Tax=Streptomyces niger TaxID=66373 RepID=UPI00069AD703|nr:nitrate- and nitrite sensing domain-containing protein [Streptomyces niger]
MGHLDDAALGRLPHGRGALAERGGRALRPRTVHARLVCLLMVPLVALVASLGAVTAGALRNASAAQQAQHIDDEIRTPLHHVVRALQEERRAAVAYLAAPTRAREDVFARRAGETARAAAWLRGDDRHRAAESAELPGRAADRLTALATELNALSQDRRQTTERSLTWQQVHRRYTSAVASALTLDATLSGASGTLPPSPLDRARELLAQEDAVLTAADLTGTLGREEQRSFTGTVAARRLMARLATEGLSHDAAAAWRTIARGRAYTDVGAMENAVSAATSGRDAARAAPNGRWRPSYEALRRGLSDFERDVAPGAARHHGPYVYGVPAFTGAALGLGFVALVLSSIVFVRIARGLTGELTTLRDEALDMARRELPETLREPHPGRQDDAPEEADDDSREAPAADEITQVRAALESVRRAVRDAAVERAGLADGVNGVFVNLARRNQVLLHRQLALLDSMERRSQEPAELGDLFRLDHLTTRMRRHAESLIILSGAAPGRAWRSPVPLTDVVRAAVSEIEDYARIEVRRLPTGAVPGNVVADLTHLLAELIENAAQFSPPHTKVRVHGEQVGTGHVLEIEDRGLGMAEEELAEANQRIAQTEATAPPDGERLGLFVVSRLASRYDVRVVLRPSVYGGTTAVVLLPDALVREARPPARTTFDPGPALDVPLERVRAHVGRRADRALEPPPNEAAASPPAGPDGLPRRIRQHSLAARLREPPPAERDTLPEESPAVSPEQARSRMTAYREGWARGSRKGEP